MTEPTQKDPESGSAPEAAPDPASGRRVLPSILVAVASLLAVLAVFALWADRQALETDSWVETSTELLADDDIREALSVYLIDQLYANVDVENEIAKLLPPEVAPLAGPAAGAARSGAEQIADRALEQPRIQALWEDANRTAHELLIDVIEDNGDAVSTANGTVTLDLSQVLTQVSAQTGLPDLSSKLPPDAATLEILRSDELSAVQEGVSLFRTFVWVVTVLALLLYAAAVYVSGDRRRETLRAVGLSFVGVGAIVLIARNQAGDALVSSLTTNSSDEPAVAATWSISTSLLAEIGGAMILYGIAVFFAAWVAGPTALATSFRRAIAPYLRQPRIAYIGAFVILVLLFWWNPTPGTSRLFPSLILIALIVGGVEVLRRRTMAEFPDRVTSMSAAGMAQSMATQTRESISRRVSARSERQQGEAAASRLEGLERLGRLRESGVLSEQEFESEKARLTGSEQPTKSMEE